MNRQAMKRQSRNMDSINEKLDLLLQQSGATAGDNVSIEEIVTATVNYILNLEGLTSTSKRVVESADYSDLIDGLS